MDISNDKLASELMKKIFEDHTEGIIKITEKDEYGKKEYQNTPCGWHREADELICQILICLGYKKTVREFHKGAKWYA